MAGVDKKPVGVDKKPMGGPDRRLWTSPGHLGVEADNGVRDVLNRGTKEEVEVWGYRRSPGRLAATLVAVGLTSGLLGLVLYWVERYWLYCTAVPSSLKQADHVLVVVS